MNLPLMGGGGRMKYKIKQRKFYTFNSNSAIVKVSSGFHLQPVSFFANGNGNQSYILTKRGL